MKRKAAFATTATVLTAMALPQPLLAGAKLKIDEDSSLDLGFRVQALYLNNDEEGIENKDEFRVRRARFRLKADITEWVTAFLQTDFSNDDAAPGGDVRLIDSWVAVKPSKLANIYAGQFMAPVGRQHLTSSGANLSMDRLGITNYNLTWGTGGRTAFNTRGLPGTSVGLRGDTNVRDLGAGVFGHVDFSETLHFKYYAGIFEGSVDRVGDPERLAGRLQVNFFDAEPGYFHSATYLGKKRTVALGVGTDMQDKVAREFGTGQPVDYEFSTADAFLELPLGAGALNVEGAIHKLDLDGATNPLTSKSTGLPLGEPANQSEGDGYFLQVGYYFADLKIQPWLGVEQWAADAANNAGDWDGTRLGLSYFIKGHNAAIKAGFESISNDTPGESDSDTFAIGFYTTY